MRELFAWLNFGEIKPAGWIFKQIETDLTKGFTGNLDKLLPELITNDDIYGKDRLTKEVKAKNVGAITHDEDWEIQYLWWNSETQSNWRDGFVRSALLTENKEFIAKAEAYIGKILSTQDDDGYLGIYAPDLRFNFTGENGELWAQATLFRVLLGYYEVTQDEKVLNAVVKAVKVIMDAYPIDNATPFKVEDAFCGSFHGLAITDVFDRLHQLTGEKKYLDYAFWLYNDYCQHDLREQDIQIKNLLNPDYRFSGHGVHTYEHLRALIIAYFASENCVLREGLNAYLAKLKNCLTPSGGPIGDEFIGKRTADATNIGYEYCSIHELLDSYTLLLQKTGDMSWGDRIEWLLYNAAQGARHPLESSIAYLKTDNSYSMTGVLDFKETDDPKKPQTRYKYSPTHQEAAVCCVPNAGRIYPYFVKAMWMRTANGLAATLYGPCNLTTTINDIQLNITEETNYPFDDNVTITFTLESPVYFALLLRKPCWAKKMSLEIKDAEISEAEKNFTIKKTWQTGDKIVLSFEADIKFSQDLKGDYFLSRGPLLFALPLKEKLVFTKEFSVSGLRELRYLPLDGDNIYEGLSFQSTSPLSARLEKLVPDDKNIWQTSIALHCELYDVETRKAKTFTFIPIGGTILRRTTFPLIEKEA